ncbi:MAG: epoxide hydrolase [Azospirillaceae bacterium]|nr:epoxide hydrolase [Azospirillaceae bacterium]
MRPFQVQWTPAQINATKAQLAACSLPEAPPGAGWALGCDREFLERFRRHLLQGFDWQGAQDNLNRYPQFLADIDGQTIHFVHVKGEGHGTRPLVLTHGWPGSHYEFWGVVDRLAFPSRHGGQVKDAFDLVIPSLPGYAYSGKPVQPMGPKATAALWNRLMTEVLGYPHYLAQGGDWGSLVASQLGMGFATAVRGIHLNMAGLRSETPPQNAEEGAWAQRSAMAQQMLSGYSMVQMMKPLSLAWATAGNPLGQAAWILERFHDWADLRGGDLEDVFGLDHLATNVLLYLMTGSFPTSLWFYHGLIREGGINLPPGRRCEVSTGFAAFPGDALMPPPPRSRIELLYNLVHWTEPAAGGHFAAMEQPDVFVKDVTAWANKVWS